MVAQGLQLHLSCRFLSLCYCVASTALPLLLDWSRWQPNPVLLTRIFNKSLNSLSLNVLMSKMEIRMYTISYNPLLRIKWDNHVGYWYACHYTCLSLFLPLLPPKNQLANSLSPSSVCFWIQLTCGFSLCTFWTLLLLPTSDSLYKFQLVFSKSGFDWFNQSPSTRGAPSRTLHLHIISSEVDQGKLMDWLPWSRFDLD